MKKLFLLSISCLLIKASGFAADATAVTNSKLKTLIIENKLDEAKVFANKELESSPGNTELIRRRGFVHFMQGDYNSAIEDFSNYLSVKPDSAKGFLYRGLAYIALGNEQKGREDVKKALTLNPALISTVNELRPKVVASADPPKKSKLVPMTTKKGVPVRTKKGAVAYKSKR